MIKLGTAFRQSLVASSMLLSFAAWHVDAIAAQLTLTWADNSADELGFAVERSIGTAGPFVEIVSMGPGITTYKDGSSSK